MAVEVETQDCTALGDADLAELADLCADAALSHEVGLLSKQVEAWVLITQVREGDKLKGFAFSTLERIGGTPSVLIGMAAVKRCSKRSTVLRALMNEQLRRAVLAFPDEDVLVGARMVSADAFEAYKALNDIVPRPGHKASGEDRAWGRRLAKRFGRRNASFPRRNRCIHFISYIVFMEIPGGIGRAMESGRECPANNGNQVSNRSEVHHVSRST